MINFDKFLAQRKGAKKVKILLEVTATDDIVENLNKYFTRS